MVGVDLFQWWAATISASSIFLSLVGVYLYLDSRKSRKADDVKGRRRLTRLLKDFVFVWVLLGLLIFYIVSIDVGSDWLFATGNIFVEILLVVYLLKNRARGSKQE